MISFFRRSLILGLCLLGLSAVANIFDRDDRIRVLPGPQDPLAPIGFLTRASDASRGTAFLVSPCLILTNLHVAVGSTWPAKDGEVLTFRVPGQEEAVIAHLVQYGSVREDGTWAQFDDWALLQLESCWGMNLGWLNLKPVPAATLIFPAQPLRIAGFPEDKDTRELTLDPQCRVRDQNWRHDCATRPGNSGGPLLTADNQVVAIAVSSRGAFMEIIRGYHESLSNGSIPVTAFWPQIQALVEEDRVRLPTQKSSSNRGD